MKSPSRNQQTLVLCILLAHCACAYADRMLVHESIIEAPVAAVWEMFTTDDGAQKWMAPKVRIDLRVGGTFHSSYHPESTLDDEHTIINRILAYDPPRMISIRNEQAPAGFDWSEQFKQTWSVIRLEPIGDLQTQVRILGLGYGEGPEWDDLYHHFEWGNDQILKTLQRHFINAAKDEDGKPTDANEDVRENETIVVEQVIGTSLDQAWRAWTTNDGAQEFFAPKTNIDLAIGSPFEIFFFPDNEPGMRGAEGLRVLSFAPNEMLAFEWNAPPNFEHAREQHTWVVLYFKELSKNETQVRLVHGGWAEKKESHPDHAEEWNQVREYFANVWPYVLRSMQRRFVDGPRWDESGAYRWE